MVDPPSRDCGAALHYVAGREEGMLLYFAYAASIEPGRMTALAPGAEFRFIAHLPEWRMVFSIPNGDSGLPSVQPESGNAVWGAVFTVPDAELDALHRSEAEEGRVPTTVQAMDREGRRHEVLTHVTGDENNGEYKPVREYLSLMVAGGRHWSLPAGWIASLEEHLENP
ncbi:MAG: gamma-glutamylcyclotransferase family protein [Acidimicrobiia bacterium]